MSDSSPSEADESRFRNMVRRSCDQLPDGYLARLEGLRRLRRIMHEEFSSAIQTAMNNYVTTHPKADLKSCRELATSINQQLREIGLILSFDGEPAVLVADFKRKGDPDSARFRLHMREESGRQHRHYLGHELKLEVMPNPLRVENFAKSFQRRR